jgi:hypothetical protein
MRRIVSVFWFLLMLEDGEPNDPAVFVTAVPNWTFGEIIPLGRGRNSHRPAVV